jgi:regulator of protease activity HflC (stomatin/prohibitin superfamily)
MTMQPIFVLAIIFAVIAIGFFVAFRLVAPLPEKHSINDIDTKKVLKRITIGLTIFTAVLIFFSSLTMVSTKNVGIVTSFGKTSGELSNGLHLIAPWENTTEMDAAIQTDSYTHSNCINVRIANQQTACVDISIRWRIVPTQADELFQNYRSFDNVRDSLVTRELTSAVNTQLSSFNPLNSISLNTPSSGTAPNPTLTQIASRVTGQMKREIGGQIEVMNTIIPIIQFDPQTQQRLNQLQQQIAATKVAEAALATAKAQAKANKELASSVDNSQNVLVSQCLTYLGEMVKNGQAVPAGFSCWPGSGLAGVIASSPTSSTTATSGK